MRAGAPALSARLLRAIRDEDGAVVSEALALLAAMTTSELAEDLADDAARIATWLNLYNAAAQRHLGTRPGLLARRHRAFRAPVMTIARTTLSLDAIEHGLLRRSRWKLGLGYLGNPWPSAFERRFRVERVDPRIHFALNCAASSCPPIAAYMPADLERQLDAATRSFLAATVRRVGGRLVVPRVFLWFQGDFGGPAGVRRFLGHQGHDATDLALRYAAWDWTPTPGAWAAPMGEGDEPAHDP